MNGAKEHREKKIIEALRNVLEINQNSCSCDECGKTSETKNNVKNHTEMQHLEQSCYCDACGKTSITADNVNKHMELLHQGQSCSCDECGETSVTQNDVKRHIQLLHADHHSSSHDADIDDQVEFDPVLWDVLLCEDEANELTKSEKQEVLKLHRYFAHRSGHKLWENLFQPAGKLKGKKKLVLDMLGKCEICKRYKKTPPRPKVGLPKARDVNDVVSLDLQIFKKDGKKEIGIMYIHDEFSKLIKGQVINDKKKETIIKGIENKWIIGDGAGPGHPLRGTFPIMVESSLMMM